jgi:hypothetical protein
VALKTKITSDVKVKKAENIEDAHRKGTVLNILHFGTPLHLLCISNSSFTFAIFPSSR